MPYSTRMTFGPDDPDFESFRMGIVRPVVGVAGWNEGRRRYFWPFTPSDRRDGSIICCVYEMDGDCAYLESGRDNVEYAEWDGMEQIEGERDVAIGLLLD